MLKKSFGKKFVILLIIVILVFLSLPCGLAMEIESLPDTWEEFCAMFSDFPDLEIENVHVRFPHQNDQSPSVTFFCDDNEWLAASGETNGGIPFSYGFVYDAQKGAYLMDDKSQENLRTSFAIGGTTGYFALAKREENWLINLIFYIDINAFSDIYFAQEPFACTWENMTDFSTSNYLMANIVVQRETENGILQIWQYPTHTIVLLRDKDGNETARMEYPVCSQFCADFMPVDPFE